MVKLANERLDDVRRRVQQETLGHRGRKDDPLYRSRRLLTKGHERLDERGNEKLLNLLEAGDPHGEVRMAWHMLLCQVVMPPRRFQPFRCNPDRRGACGRSRRRCGV